MSSDQELLNELWAAEGKVNPFSVEAVLRSKEREMAHWHAPLDPECPEVEKMWESLNDPIMRMSGCGGEFFEAFERKHRAKCERCQEYGAANIDVV